MARIGGDQRRGGVRLAVVSDVHGNLTAFDAVIADIERRRVKHVAHAGDLALGGCHPAEVIDRIRELGWPGIVGNTDELLWRPEQREVQEQRSPALRNVLRMLFDKYAPATLELLGEERLNYLRELPTERREQNAVLFHASPGDLWRAPQADDDDTDLVATYGRCGADIVIYGHIHCPYVRRVNRFTVVNCGSVGAPLDGDPRASYLLLEGDEPQIIRVEYDIEREADLLRRSRYPDADRLAEMRRVGKALAVGAL